jgi:hypothetical protein
MAFLRSQMLYDDGVYYKWTAREDADNPYYRNGSDHTLLNRTEGYEVLYFINHIGAKNWVTTPPNLPTYQKIEKMIRYDVPSTTRSHKGVEDWILANWSRY